ncbi:MAG: hypothetical protein JWM20_112 [Patescibacteria group bacterium]|nr:hypothetical protein [Patescibacteria group bacterium]
MTSAHFALWIACAIMITTLFAAAAVNFFFYKKKDPLLFGTGFVITLFSSMTLLYLDPGPACNDIPRWILISVLIFAAIDCFYYYFKWKDIPEMQIN